MIKFWLIVLVVVSTVGGLVFIGLRPCYRQGQLVAARINVRETRDRFRGFVASRRRCPAPGEVKVSRDPWGQPLVITCPGRFDPQGADVVSSGRDRRRGTADDIESWTLACKGGACGPR